MTSNCLPLIRANIHILLRLRSAEDQLLQNGKHCPLRQRRWGAADLIHCRRRASEKGDATPRKTEVRDGP